MNIVETLKRAGIAKALDYLSENPATNVPKLLKWIKTIDKKGMYKGAYETIEKVMADKDNNWYKMIDSLYTDIDPEVRKVLFRNFILNSAIVGNELRHDLSEKNDCNIPWAILLDPTSACNLKCIGCWAAEYGNRLNLTYEELDNIINQGKEMGTYMYIYTGGEPLVRKDDIIRLCEKHDDCVFLCFTNSTLIDEAFANEMLRVKNFIPSISIEGFEEATDARRGKGTYKAIEKAMAILKAKKLPFGISCCYTSQNVEVIGSEEYFDDVIAKGAKFAWFFTYMPIGVGAGTELMASAEQREFMYRKIRNYRQTKSIFTMDFWNDGEFVGGCIAGGREYLHINANGDIEPCVFAHYSDSNIREKTLLEAYKSPMFMAYRRRQPFSNNLLRPCPILDNNGKLEEMVKEAGAESTDCLHKEDVHSLTEKCRDVAVDWEPIANELWDFEKGRSIGVDGLKKLDKRTCVGACASCNSCN